MTGPRTRKPPTLLTWCDQRTIELLQTSMHPAPRLFPMPDEDALNPRLDWAIAAAPPGWMSRLRQAAEAANLAAGPRARRLLSWCTGLWGEPAR